MNEKLNSNESLEQILAKIKSSSIPNSTCGQWVGYSDDWYCAGEGGVQNGWWDGSQWIGTDGNPIALPGVVCTPNGNYPDYSSYWSSYYGWSGYGYDHYNDDQGGGGDVYYDNSHHNYDQATIMSQGQSMIDHLTQTIQDNTAIWFKEAQDSKTFALASAASLAGTDANIQYDVVQILKANQGIIRTLGDAMARTNTAISWSVAAIGLLDGDITTSDVLAGASAFFGTIGLFTTAMPWIGFTCDGISFVLGVASTVCQNQEQNKNGNY